MSQNGEKHFKNLATNAARFLSCAWQFWDVMYEKVHDSSLVMISGTYSFLKNKQTNKQTNKQRKLEG